jgi:RNA polymerase sigma-70 factor (ECF subfamily)
MDEMMHDLNGLLGRVALGDRKAFSALYDASGPKLFGILLRILKNRQEAEDALQDVFVKVWRRADRFNREAGSAETWLAAVARNHAIDALRARRPEASSIDEAYDLAGPDPDPEKLALLRSEGMRIHRCMQTLESDRRDAVRKAYVEGRSYQELADHYNVPLNTMRTWLRRSLLKLRECLGQ